MSSILVMLETYAARYISLSAKFFICIMVLYSGAT
jgi:hypothetical protein